MEKTEISSSEWEVMRIVWTLGETTSSQMIEILFKKKEWSSSTIKTLLSRLTDKGFLNVRKDGRKNIYVSSINEQDAYSYSAERVFNNMCCMHYGETIYNIINDVELSRNDVDALIKLLNDKKENAPEKVHCHCIEN